MLSDSILELIEVIKSLSSGLETNDSKVLLKSFLMNRDSKLVVVKKYS